MGKGYDSKDDPLGALPKGSLHTLAELLAFPPSLPADRFFASQRQRIKALPKSSGLVRTTSLATFFSMDRFVRHRLCKDHLGLRPELMAWVLHQLAVVCSTRTDRYRGYADRLDGDCPDAVRDFVHRMAGTAGLWLRPAEFDDRFGADVPAACRLERVRGASCAACAACVLSVVGARAQTLVDLRAEMVARARPGSAAPRLLALVDAWIDVFGGRATGRFLRDESDAFAAELARIRAFLRDYRRQKRRARRLEEEEAGRKEAAYYNRSRTPGRSPVNKTLGFFRSSAAGEPKSPGPSGSPEGTAYDEGEEEEEYEYESPNTSFGSGSRFDLYDDDDGADHSRSGHGRDDMPKTSPAVSSDRSSSRRSRDGRSVLRGRRSTTAKDADDRSVRVPASFRSPRREHDPRQLRTDSSPMPASVRSINSDGLDEIADDDDGCTLAPDNFGTHEAYEACMALRENMKMEEKLRAKQREMDERRAKKRSPSAAPSSIYSQDDDDYDDDGEKQDSVSALPTFDKTPRRWGSSKSKSGSRPRRNPSVRSVGTAASDTYETIVPESLSDSDEERTPNKHATDGPYRHPEAARRLRASFVDVNEADGMPDVPPLARRMQDDALGGRRRRVKDGEGARSPDWEEALVDRERKFNRQARRDGSIRAGTRYRDVTREGR